MASMSVCRTLPGRALRQTALRTNRKSQKVTYGDRGQIRTTTYSQPPKGTRK